MPDFITLAEARAHLYIDVDGTAGSPHDPWLETWIPIVESAVKLWLKDEWRAYVPEVDSAGDVVLDSAGDAIPTSVVQPAVRGAVFVELASQFRFRDGDGVATVPSNEGHGYVLCRAATYLLNPLRKSTVR